MDPSVEFLIPSDMAKSGSLILESLYAHARKIGARAFRTTRYRGEADWLVIYGVGAAEHRAARDAQLARGGRAILWDFGYFGKKKLSGPMRISIDSDHPQRYLDCTTNARSRWDSHEIELRSGFDAAGPVILVALTQKTVGYLGPKFAGWDQRKLDELRARFPDRKIVYRPKPNRHPSQRLHLDCPFDDNSPIEELLAGASLVVTRHSNVAVDAAIAGVPVECEEGAALWLKGKPYTPETRLDFLCRLAYWQYRCDEAAEAWAFIRMMIEATGNAALIRAA